MATYVVLYNLTEQGIKEAKNAPGRIRATAERLAGQGGKMVGWYATMGQYDAVAIIEAPNDETVARGMLALGAEGRVRSTTLKAFTLDEFEKITSGLP
jgi:uncharacterized protein with GYD domain